MSGEQAQETRNQPIPATAATKQQPRAKDDRTGPYGGDDGALEHDRTEIAPADKLTPDDAETKTTANRARRQ